MIKIIFFCFFSIILIENVLASPIFCPSANNFRHMGSGAIWEISNESAKQGWSVSQSPAANNFRANIPLSNPLHVVLSNANDSKKFYLTCKYELTEGLTVDVYNTFLQIPPTHNTNFKKINDTTYVCETTINNPNACVSDTMATLPFYNDATGGPIN